MKRTWQAPMKRTWQAALKARGLLVLVLLFGVAWLGFGQAVQSKDLSVMGSNQKALMYNGFAFAGLEFASALGLESVITNQAVLLKQGGKIIRLALADGAYEAATQWNNGLEVNGVRQKSPAAGIGAAGKVLIPVRSVAEAAGASFEESASGYLVSLPQANLGTVSSDKTDQSDRIVLEVDRDVGFSSRLEKNNLIVTLRFTAGDAAPYQVGGKFVDIFEVKQNANKLEVQIALKPEYGYLVYAVAASQGIPARVIIDVGPRFDRVNVALDTRPSIIVLDPGHGGSDSGIVLGNLREKEITLSMARRIAAILAPRGIKIKYTRDSDKTVSLEERQALSVKADVLISLHVSSMPGTTASGAEIFYLSPDAPAEGILGAGRDALENPKSERDRKLLARFLSPRAASQRLADIISARILSVPNGAARVSGLTNHTALERVPKAGVVLELGYLTSEKDRALLQNADESANRAEAVAYAILEYLGKPVPVKKPISTGNPPK
jgi:N-acetylmuramoyl-L-alanine amidase